MRWSPGCACCEPASVVTACCQTYDTVAFPDGGFLRVPAAQVVDANCTLPDFGNLIVELNGSIHPTCDVNGSYSVPNSASCNISGDARPAGSCNWSGRFTEACVSGGVSRLTHIYLWVKPGIVQATVGTQKATSLCNANNTFGDPGIYLAYAEFELDFDGSSVPDFGSPTEIPCVTAYAYAFDGTNFLYSWDAAEPLVVYF